MNLKFGDRVYYRKQKYVFYSYGRWASALVAKGTAGTYVNLKEIKPVIQVYGVLG